ncbi:uncharacterized protein VP01_386g15 [Puccinia sorghi]|uniref:Uncharacterized protein n=1 Tax=Puccinia sorghi TaxID=27349 RepID=A0A0L6USY8_9BASI|nr:uncharacterized protein VP01_386g15 [Puccinia sorghi]
MPRSSRRAQSIRKPHRNTPTAHQTTSHINKKRYLAEPTRLERPPDITNYLLYLNTTQFKQEFRMSQDSFLNLVSMIVTHPVFHNNSNISQRPVQDQLTNIRRISHFVLLTSERGNITS